MPATTNPSVYLRELDRLVPDGPQTAEIRNVMEYATHLHNLEGYYVVDEAHFTDTVTKWIVDALAAGQPLERALEAAVKEEINFLRSYTSEMRPPVRAGQGARQAHPGHWSDVTNNLRNGYRGRVNDRAV